jgi:glycosyltransferase involved in cell wall biosynthesis
MNILHINTLDSGGAFQVSFRLHQGLLLENFPSKVLVLYQNKHYQEVHPFLKSQNYWQKIKQSIHYKFLRSQHNNLLKNKSAVQFSFTQSPFKLHKHPLVLEADIIHLHWVANFLDYSSFFKQVKKPIVWTLHDMYPFSGGFHYKSYESDEYQILNQEILVQKQEALSQCNNLHIVSPSLWIYKESSASQLLKNFTNYHIPYGLDLNIFKPYLKEGARNYFNIPTNKKIVLFVSEFLQDKRKGLTYL